MLFFVSGKNLIEYHVSINYVLFQGIFKCLIPR